MSRKQKSEEIQRFLQVIEALQETPATLEEKTGISARTINNYIWNDTSLGGPLLRALAEQFAVSVDWLLTGRGTMFSEDAPPPNRHKPLMPFFQTVNLETVQDFWWLAARGVEESLMQSGAVPGVDYGYLDLYRLAQPLVASKFADGDLALDVHEAAGP